MLQTYEIRIDASGRMFPLDALPPLPAGRALLTLMPTMQDSAMQDDAPRESAAGVFDDLFGLLKATHAVSLEEMDEG